MMMRYIYWPGASAFCVLHTHKLALLLSPAASPHLSAMAATFIVVRPSPALAGAGLPRLRLSRAEGLRCRCSSKKASSALAPMVAKGAPLLTKASCMASAAPMLASALALVDEGMSSERTGRSNDLLGWVLLLALGLVLCFYAVYSTTFDDDDDQSGGGGGITL